eukprot:28423-Pelagococcus_subviridis.AAC.4
MRSVSPTVRRRRRDDDEGGGGRLPPGADRARSPSSSSSSRDDDDDATAAARRRDARAAPRGRADAGRELAARVAIAGVIPARSTSEMKCGRVASAPHLTAGMALFTKIISIHSAPFAVRVDRCE